MEGLLARLKGIAASSQKAAKQLAAYQSLLSDPVNNASSREKSLEQISRLVREFPDSEVRVELEKWLSGERTAFEKDKEEFRFGFGTSLAQELKQVGLEARGQLPVLRVGMFSARIDFGAGKAVVFWGPEVERLKGLPRLVPAELARTLAQWTKSLKERAQEPAKLAKRLAEAYKRVCDLNGLQPGMRVMLADVLAELVLMMQPRGFRADPSRDKFVEYPRVRFSYDLFRLKASGELAGSKLRMHVATFDATTDRTKALWVPDNEEGEGTYYSYLSVSGEA